MWLVWGGTAFVAALRAQSSRRARYVGRMALALLFIAFGAAVNAWYLAFGQDYYEPFADASPFAGFLCSPRTLGPVPRPLQSREPSPVGGLAHSPEAQAESRSPVPVSKTWTWWGSVVTWMRSPFWQASRVLTLTTMVLGVPSTSQVP